MQDREGALGGVIPSLHSFPSYFSWVIIFTSVIPFILRHGIFHPCLFIYLCLVTHVTETPHVPGAHAWMQLVVGFALATYVHELAKVVSCLVFPKLWNNQLLGSPDFGSPASLGTGSFADWGPVTPPSFLVL